MPSDALPPEVEREIARLVRVLHLDPAEFSLLRAAIAAHASATTGDAAPASARSGEAPLADVLDSATDAHNHSLMDCPACMEREGHRQYVIERLRAPPVPAAEVEALAALVTSSERIAFIHRYTDEARSWGKLPPEAATFLAAIEAARALLRPSPESGRDAAKGGDDA